MYRLFVIIVRVTETQSLHFGSLSLCAFPSVAELVEAQNVVPSTSSGTVDKVCYLLSVDCCLIKAKG